MVKLINTIHERWNAHTPKFFRGVKRLSIAIIMASTSVWMANTYFGLDLHHYILTFCKYAIAVGAATGVTAQLTKDQ